MAQRYYFSTQSTAWAFAQLVSEAHRFTITDYGMEFERPTDQYFVELLDKPAYA